MNTIRRLSYLVLLLFAFLVKTLAQWVQTEPYGGDVQCLVVTGSAVFAGTSGGGVFLSTDRGINWKAVNTGLTNANVLALAANGTNLFAGTYGDGSVYLSTNHGTSWRAVNGGLNNRIVTAFASNGTNLFAGTSSGGMFFFYRQRHKLDSSQHWLDDDLRLYTLGTRRESVCRNGRGRFSFH